MSKTAISMLPAGQIAKPQYADDRNLLLFERFADKVDHSIQNTLVSNLMMRYTEIAARLEETNRRLELSDSARLEAQRIALLGNWSLDLATRTITWSETMYDLLELPSTQTPNLEVFLQAVHPDDAAFVRSAAQDTFSGSVPIDLTYRLRMPDGRIKWVIARHVGVKDANGKPVSLHGTLQDITQPKTAEEALRRMNDHLEELVEAKGREIYATQISTIYALVKLAESRDDDTGDHIGRTSQYCRLMAALLREGSVYAAQIDDRFVDNIAKASPLHDIGKVGIPDSILLKPGRLTAEEFAIMKTHVTVGYETLASVVTNYPGNAYLKMGMDIARYHHEKWDGSGYQEGLSGEEIPLSARIMAISDVYDALRSRRVYKEPYSHEKSSDILMSGRGSHFDPVLVDVFLAHQDEFRAIFDTSAAHIPAEPSVEPQP